MGSAPCVTTPPPLPMRPPHTLPQSPPMGPPSLCTLRPQCMRPPPPPLPLFTLLQSPPMRPQPPPPHMVSLRVLQPTSRTHTLVNLIFIYLSVQSTTHASMESQNVKKTT